MSPPVAASSGPPASRSDAGAGSTTLVFDCSPVITRSRSARWAMARAPVPSRMVPASRTACAQARQKAGWWGPSMREVSAPSGPVTVSPSPPGASPSTR